ncbi:MAG: tetratricopeptide repeat protein, partial [Myxococcales bacterium]|nr:tetratricopeptide repeat protein [Myxococcales bacterium]
MKHTITLVLLTLAFVLTATQAFAQPDVDERARVHFTSGRAYFDSGDYARALQEFQQAYALSHREELHYNLFLCQERIGNVSEAIRELEAFLATNPPDRALLEPRLAALRTRQQHEAEEQAAREQERLETQRRAEEAEARAREAQAPALAAAEAAGDAASPSADSRPGVHPRPLAASPAP